MTFELVRYGWPNIVAVLALAAIPFVSLGLPAEPRATPSHVESIDDSEQRPMVGIASVTRE